MKLQLPRPTALYRKQERLLAEGLQAAWDDPEIQACWLAIAREVHVVLNRPVESWGTAPHVSPIATEIGVDPCVVFSTLISLLQERVPALAHAWGPDLGFWILGLMFGIVAPEIGAVTPATVQRFLPDNPVTISRDPSTGKAMLHGAETATARHLMQIRSYFQSLAPPGKTGRPKGLPKPKKSGKGSLPPDLALRVHEAKLDGMTFRQIVRQVLHTTIPSDHRVRERLRAKVNRLNAQGARLKLKKSSIS
ncbi:MAG: hypothetical protein O6949_07500 [Chloroflexi bacterium]|nr:hypothetical protein [Chloroflexota bacterium]